MKCLWGILIFLLVPTLSYAASIDCSKVVPIKITSSNPISQIKAEIDNFKNHPSPDGTEYWLCFEFPNGTNFNKLTQTLLIKNTSSLPLVISGLILTTGQDLSPMIWVDGSNSVTIHNASISCTNKIGNGIKLTGQNHKVLKTTVQQCKVGLQIGDGARPGNNMQVEQDTAFSNGTAFKLAYGWGNFFKYNSVFENDANNDGIFAGEEGIFFEEAVNADMTMPILLNSKDEIYAGKDDESVLRYSAACDPNKKEWGEEAVVKFRSSYPISETEISLNGEDAYHEDQYQGKEFFKKIECTSNRDVNNLYNTQCVFRLNEKTQSFWAVLISHQSTYGSSPYSFPFKLNGPCGPGILSAADQGAAGATGGSGIIEVASAGGPTSEPATPGPNHSEEDDEEGGNNMGASTPTGDTAGSTISGGVAATGAPGGVGGCGGSLYQTSTGSIPTLFTILIAIISLVGIRKEML